MTPVVAGPMAMDVVTSENMGNTRYGIVAVLTGAVTVIAVVGAGWYTLQSRPVTVGVLEALYANDPLTAIEAGRRVVASDTASYEEKAQSLILTTLLSYSTDGDVEHTLRDVAVLKDIVTDPRFAPITRAQALNTLGMLYERTNRNTVIFDAIFSGEPYESTLLKENEGGTVLKNPSLIALFKASYDLEPTASAAINTASQSVRDIYMFPSMPASVKSARLTDAKVYVEYATSLTARERLSDPAYEKRYTYGQYLRQRAYVLAGLADFLPEEYQGGYRAAYETAISELSSSNIHSVSEQLPHVRWYYASFLLALESDEVAARLQLQGLLNEVTPGDGFVEFIAEIKALPTSTSLSDRLNATRAASPEFKAYVDSI